MIRVTRIRYGCWRYLSHMTVLHFDTDFSYTYGDIILTILCPCMRHKTIQCDGIIVYCD